VIAVIKEKPIYININLVLLLPYSKYNLLL